MICTSIIICDSILIIQNLIVILILILITMGGCFSIGRRVDLTGNTFSHYSLSSQSEHIDLYPGFRSGPIILTPSGVKEF